MKKKKLKKKNLKLKTKLKEKTKKPAMTIEFREVNHTSIKAEATILHGPFTMTGFNVVKGRDGYFVGNPSSSYMKDGQRKYKWLVYIQDEERREKFQSWVLEEFHRWNPKPEEEEEIEEEEEEEEEEEDDDDIDDDDCPF